MWETSILITVVVLTWFWFYLPHACKEYLKGLDLKKSAATVWQYTQRYFLFLFVDSWDIYRPVMAYLWGWQMVRWKCHLVNRGNDTSRSVVLWPFYPQGQPSIHTVHAGVKYSCDVVQNRISWMGWCVQRQEATTPGKCIKSTRLDILPAFKHICMMHACARMRTHIYTNYFFLPPSACMCSHPKMAS